MSTAPNVTAHLSESGGRIVITADDKVVREIANTTRETAGTWLVITRDHVGCVRIEGTDTDHDTVAEMAAECAAWTVWAVAVQLQAHAPHGTTKDARARSTGGVRQGAERRRPEPDAPTVEVLLDDTGGRLNITVDGVRARQLPAGPLTAAGRWVAVVQLDNGTIGIGCVHTDREVAERYVATAAAVNLRWAAACQVQ